MTEKIPVVEVPRASRRVMRGNSWGRYARSTRASNRTLWPPGNAGVYVGFRPARSNNKETTPPMMTADQPTGTSDPALANMYTGSVTSGPSWFAQAPYGSVPVYTPRKRPHRRRYTGVRR